MIFCFAILKCKVVFQQQQVLQAVSWQRNKNLKIVGLYILFTVQKLCIWNQQTIRWMIISWSRKKIDFDSCKYYVACLILET